MKLNIIFLKFLFLPLVVFAFEPGFDESYYKLSPKEQRKIFIQKIDALLDISFQKIEQEQNFVNDFFKKYKQENFANADKTELDKLNTLKTKYRIKNLFDYEEYQQRIGTVPKSMAIAQAIVESATGTSRFAKEANNLFGEWTWGEKGLVPKQRAEGKTHKIRIFDSLQESVDSYVLNLNRHNAYKEFRQKRFNALQKKQDFKGLEAIESLYNYSQIKGEYTNILRKVIKGDKLYLLD